MVRRVMEHYGHPVKPDFAEYMITKTGLNERDQQLVRDLRKYQGDTQFFADLAGMTLKQYSEAMGRISKRMIDVLLELAQEGYAHRK